MTTLNKPQQELLVNAQNMKPTVYPDGSVREPRIHVQGHTYDAAKVLDREGLGILRRTGSNSGWFSAKEQA